MLNIMIKDAASKSAAVVLEGRLDTTTAPRLEAILNGWLDGITTLTLDVEKLEYISSFGLRVLLAVHKSVSKRGEMRIVHAGGGVLEILEVTGFSNILTVE